MLHEPIDQHRAARPVHEATEKPGLHPEAGHEGGQHRADREGGRPEQEGEVAGPNNLAEEPGSPGEEGRRGLRKIPSVRSATRNWHVRSHRSEPGRDPGEAGGGRTP